MNTVRSTDLFSAAAGSKLGRNGEYDWVFSESRIRITQEDIENSGRQQKCGNTEPINDAELQVYVKPTLDFTGGCWLWSCRF